MGLPPVDGNRLSRVFPALRRHGHGATANTSMWCKLSRHKRRLGNEKPSSRHHCHGTDGRKWLEEYAENHTLFKLPNESIPCNDGNVCIELKDVWFRYEKDSPDVLKGLSLNVFKGEFVIYLVIEI